MVTQPSRRSMFAGSVSLTFHAGLVALAIAVVGMHAIRAPAVELTPIEVFDPSPAVPGPSGPGTQAGSGATTKAGERGRRGQDPPKRSMTKAPPRRDPFADVVMGYDAPETANPGSATGGMGGGLGTGLFGTGTGDGDGFGLFGDGAGVPEPPASHAQPPRPKHDYRQRMLTKVRKFAGLTVTLKLTIDPRGVVRKAEVLRSVEPSIDRQAIAVARSFEFFPGLADNGDPRWGTFRWDFVIDQPPLGEADGSMNDDSSLDWRRHGPGT